MSVPQQVLNTIAQKPQVAKSLENTSKNWKEMAESGKLQSAVLSLKDLAGVFNTSEPAMSVLVGQLKAETTKARVELMKTLLGTLQEESVKTAIDGISSFLNNVISTGTSLITLANEWGIIGAAMNGLSNELNLITGKLVIFNRWLQNIIRIARGGN
jgi:hypothetical protein